MKSKNPIQINAILVEPIHNKIIVGVGRVIVFFDAITGKELGHCEKHMMDVSCLSFRKDRKVFASGGKI